MNQKRDSRTRENRERADTNTQLSSDDWDTQTHSSQTTNRGPTNSVITLNNLFANSNASLNTTAAAKPAANPKMILHTTKRRTTSNLSQKKARLVYNTSFGGKCTFTLDNETTSIGRKEKANDIVLLCAKISKQHAVVQRDANTGHYYVKDQASSNGIKVNDVSIPPSTQHLLTDGDNISIGSINLKFYDDCVGEDFGNDKTLKVKKRGGDDEEEERLKLVTILPSEKKYEETVTIRAEVSGDGDEGFNKVDEVDSIQTLKEDYEKLRLAYELSKVSLTNDITSLLAKSLDLMFEILPIDRGVILLVDLTTGILSTHYVKLREGKENEGREILLSSTILRKVFESRMSLITSDACEDPMLGKAMSVRTGQIRSVICVPLVAHGKVHGILHLDSRDRINSFSAKDLSLVKAISNQTAVAIENNILIKEVENKARITEQLSRFLAPHVVDKMVNKSEIIRKGGRLLEGTIIFVDIRGFTNLSENAAPGEVVNLLNEYFERLVKIVFAHDGVVDKYIGDALMAVFGTLEEEISPEFRAVSAGLEFIGAIDGMNKERIRVGKEPITIGVGINTGELLAGFIGCSQRLEYTCIGDTVNTSSRICSMAAKDEVLISEYTYEKVKDRVEVQSVGFRTFKGKEKEVMIYRAVGLK